MVCMDCIPGVSEMLLKIYVLYVKIKVRYVLRIYYKLTLKSNLVIKSVVPFEWTITTIYDNINILCKY